MGKDPDRIREEIEETRAQMDDTVDALGYKADVKSRVRDSISEKKDAVTDKAGSLVSSVTGAVPGKSDVAHGARRGVGVARENPIGLAIGGAAVGFVAGLLVPTTRMEDEHVGEVADEFKERARETGQQAVDRGKEVAQGAAEGARDVARQQESGDQMAADLSPSRETSLSAGESGGGSSA